MPTVCHALPVRRQTYGYLPSSKESMPFDGYQVVLLGNRGLSVSSLSRSNHNM